MNYPEKVKEVLLNKIGDMAEKCHWLFTRNPESDFTRKRKLDFEKMILILLSVEDGSLKKELLKFFQFDIDSATVSAFNQQRAKLLPEALAFLFYDFNEAFEDFKTFQGYRLFACDGSDLNIARNPEDPDTYFQSTPNDKGFNQLHLNALYDLYSRRYVDAIIQPARKENEFQACIDMMKRSDKIHNIILTADRGYENYNILAHAESKGWKYVIRIKDKNSNGIASGLNLPVQESFDTDFSLLMTRRQTKDIIAHPEAYKFMPSNQKFDFLPVGDKGTYPMSFRILRFPISENSYEMIITNLDRNAFSLENIKEIYHLRWGIETSFRELKYAIGLTCFHSKKAEYIMQEIYARLLLYNFCESITTHVVILTKDTKHIYQLNYTLAIHICRYFLECKDDIPPPDVEALIKKNLLPVRYGRHNPRKVKPKSTISFLYRVA